MKMHKEFFKNIQLYISQGGFVNTCTITEAYIRYKGNEVYLIFLQI